MQTVTRNLVIAALLVLVIAAIAYTQLVPKATAGMRLAWDQSAASLAEAQSYRFAAYVDGSTTGSVVAATCTGAAAPFTCAIPLPVAALGDHTVIVASQVPLGDDLWSDESRSEAFSFRVVSLPDAPARLRLVR